MVPKHIPSAPELGKFILPEWAIKKAGVIEPENVACMIATGNCMYPTIQDGDVIIAEFGAPVVDNGIYLFEEKGKFYVKRLKPLGDQIMALPDNRLHIGALYDAGQIEVLGRAVGIIRFLIAEGVPNE